MSDGLDEFRVDEAEKLSGIRRERDRWREHARRAEDENATLKQVLGVVGKIEALHPDPPKWLTPASPKKHNATLMKMLSDLHLDETIRPSEVSGVNAYNREIATGRLERDAENTVKLARHYLSGVTWDGMVLMLGGDLVSGDIHEELSQTNADTILGTMLYWSEQLSAYVARMAEEFGKVHVVSVPGNHGRMSRKPRAKLRAQTNFDWLLSHLVQRSVKAKGVTWQIPDAADVTFKVYDRWHLLTHGDQAHGGNGIGGIFPPIMRLRARKLQHYASIGQGFDVVWMGHWHQYLPTPSLVVNGSLKGFDEFAMLMGFSSEPPIQALAVATPERGLTFTAPVFSMDRLKEGW